METPESKPDSARGISGADGPDGRLEPAALLAVTVNV